VVQLQHVLPVDAADLQVPQLGANVELQVPPILLNAARPLVRLGIFLEVAIGELVDGGLGGALIADARRILAIGDRAAQPDRLRSRLLRRDLAVAPEHNPPLSAA
jgi:hypothetical protein